MGGVLAFLFFGAFQLTGVLPSLRLHREESPGARLLLGFSGWAHLGALFAALALCLAALIGPSPRFRGLGASLGRHKGLLLPLCLWIAFAFLAGHSFRYESSAVFSSQATYGDMSMHLSFITSLARQGTFPPEYSLLPGVRLCYPFLSDSISSSLLLCGASLRFAYLLPMLTAGAQVFFGFFLLARRVLGSEGKAVFSSLLFFLNGGLGIFWFLGSGEDFSRIFTGFYETPTNYTAANLRWVNTVVDMMLPQRATLFGWAVLFPALYVLYRAVFEGRSRLFWVGGVLAGLLPMVHTHSFLALALSCLGWLLAGFLRGWGVRAVKLLVAASLPIMALLQPLLRALRATESPRLMVFALCVLGALTAAVLGLVLRAARRTGLRPWLSTWGVLLGAAVCLALPQFCLWTFRQVGPGFIRGHFAWVVGEDDYLWFYLKNLGLAGILALLGLLTARRDTLCKVLPALLIWFLAEFVEFQPNDYVNNKLLYVAFVFLTFAAAEFSAALLARLRRKTVRCALAAGALAVLVSAALPTWGREAVASYELFGEGALNLCRFVEDRLPAGAVFLTDMRHNNELAALAGRSVVCGSPAYLYFHGLPYSAREKDLPRMYEDPAHTRDLLDRYHVSYILVSDFERASYAVDQPALDALYPRIYDDGSRVLYQVSKEAQP